MALGTSQFSNSTVVSAIPEIWTPLVLDQLFAKTVAANFFTDLSEFAADGGDILHVHDVFTNTMSSNAQSTQGAAINLQNPATTDIQLTINTHRYAAIQVGDLTLKQMASSPTLNRLYTQRMGSVLADDLEDSILGLWSGITTNSVGDTATVLSDAEVRQAIEKLATANFDLRECGWFLHPYCFWVQLSAVAKYYDMSQAGGTGSFVREGNFGPMDASRGLQGHLYGMPIYVTSNVVTNELTHRNLLAHKSALGFATQTPGGSRVRVQAENVIDYLSTVVVADIIYGVLELRDAAAVVVNSDSAFIGS